MGALSPCRDPFTLTSILSHQGRGGKGAKAHFRTNDGLGGRKDEVEAPRGRR